MAYYNNGNPKYGLKLRKPYLIERFNLLFDGFFV